MLVRRSKERGFADHGWLKSFHTFSFGSYYDPKFMNFSDLRVINQDTVLAGGGFSTHPHHNMEILSFVIEGELSHVDTLGNQSIIKAGEIQVMSAGTGIQHSERNHDPKNPVHFLQIWILPNQMGGMPSYQQESYLEKQSTGKWTELASDLDGGGLVKIRQNASLFLTKTDNGGSTLLKAQKEKKYWLQVLKGELELADTLLAAGDAAAWDTKNEIFESFKWRSVCGEVLLFELN